MRPYWKKRRGHGEREVSVPGLALQGTEEEYLRGSETARPGPSTQVDLVESPFTRFEQVGVISRKEQPVLGRQKSQLGRQAALILSQSKPENKLNGHQGKKGRTDCDNHVYFT
jgi:hypothetical protein